MEQSITVKIADRSYPLKVTSPEHEEVIRKAADEINRKLGFYQGKFPNKGIIELLSFVALNVCMANISLQKQAAETAAAEEELAKELAGYLDKMDKNSR